jgi:hypothetical protein
MSGPVMRSLTSIETSAITTECEGFSVGDCVTYEYHGDVVTGYIRSIITDSYLFVLNGNIRPYAMVVRNWSNRHITRYGYAVLLSQLTHSLLK